MRRTFTFAVVALGSILLLSSFALALRLVLELLGVWA